MTSAPETAEVPHSRDSRHEFTPDQIIKYIAKIGLPAEYASSPILKDKSLAQQEDHAIPFLGTLMRYHMAKIPFEDIALHYSQGRYATLDIAELYERMVTSPNGGGGYCFQQNAFFGTVLRSLGFEVMSTAARVNSAVEPTARNPNFKGPSYNPWNHMVNIVTISSKDYLVDVGMNAWGPVVPLELKINETVSISPRRVRLTRGAIPEHVSRRLSNQQTWLFEVSNGEGQAWVPTYCFSLTEFLPIDYVALNWYVSTNKSSWFTQAVVCGKLVLSDDGTKVDGDETLFGNTLLRRIHAEVKEQIECKSEADRVKVLEEHFGVILTPYERNAIMGTVAQIP